MKNSSALPASGPGNAKFSCGHQMLAIFVEIFDRFETEKDKPQQSGDAKQDCRKSAPHPP